ncbi:MAG TPA: hypothetical protein VIS74_02105, partial [Chthoniobacterales bacterium]
MRDGNTKFSTRRPPAKDAARNEDRDRRLLVRESKVGQNVHPPLAAPEATRAPASVFSGRHSLPPVEADDKSWLRRFLFFIDEKKKAAKP